jgi:hypothetical protein
MTAPRIYRELHPYEREALEAFAAHFGRNRWRAILTDEYWYNARIWEGPTGESKGYGYALHAIRNDFGPDWLRTVYKPAKA